MKKMKKIFALVIACVMMIAMAVPTMAGTIKITKDESYKGTGGRTYSAYKIFDAEYDSLAGTNTQAAKDPAYTPNDAKVAYFMATGNPWISTVQGMTAYFDVKPAADGSGYTVALKDGVDNNATTAKAIATALNNALSTVNPTGDYAAKTITPGGDAVTVDDGYYLIVASDGATNLTLVTTDVNIIEKNTYPGLDKTEEKPSVTTGQVENYTITVDIPEDVANKDIIIVDTITKGLTLNTAITVEGAADGLTSLTFVENSDYVADPAGSAKQYKATIPAANVIANKGKTLTLKYSATVNTDAIVYEPEKNKAHLEYDNYSSTDVEVIVKNYGFELDKVDKDKKTITTDDGEFSLWTAATGGEKIDVVKVEGNTYRVAVEGETGVAILAGQSGKAIVNGLAAGTYYLQEDVAPTGYNKLDARTPVEIVEDATTAVPIQVINNAGAVLPSTGGIGTTIFYIVGAILVIGAGVLLVTRRRMNTK